MRWPMVRRRPGPRPLQTPMEAARSAHCARISPPPPCAPLRPPPAVVYAAPHASAAAPAPAAYETAYHLDAGDKLRVVVYGQEGLTNTYAVSAGGSITMPLIGSVPARRRTTARLA